MSRDIVVPLAITNLTSFFRGRIPTLVRILPGIHENSAPVSTRTFSIDCLRASFAGFWIVRSTRKVLIRFQYKKTLALKQHLTSTFQLTREFPSNLAQVR